MGIDVINSLFHGGDLFSACSTEFSQSNSSSRAITNSTVSRESAPKSPTNDESFRHFAFTHAQLFRHDFRDAFINTTHSCFFLEIAKKSPSSGRLGGRIVNTHKPSSSPQGALARPITATRHDAK